MLRHNNNSDFLCGLAAIPSLDGRLQVVRVEYGVILPPPICLNYQIISKLYKNILKRSRRGLCCALL